MKRLAFQTTHLLLDFPVGIFWFVVIVTGLATGVGTLITLVGLPILTATFIAARAGAELERLRAEAFLGIEIKRPHRPEPAKGWLSKLLAPFHDPAAWKALLYAGFVLPLRGIFSFVIIVSLVATAGAAATLPFYFWALPHHGVQVNDHSYWNEPWQIAVITLGGLVLGYITVWVIRALAWVDVQFIRGLLGASRRASLERRVDAAVDASATERKRIERDLHDGAQQRLVTLGMDLGLALEKLDSEPAEAKALLADAHTGVKEALAELRNLARGIHPAILTDRGLDAALSALAARAPIPVEVDVELDRRPPASVEAAAYFVVAEGLTNVAKHAQAQRASVDVSRADGRVRVVVADDGRGGAEAVDGGGLAGLAERVASLDGYFAVRERPGGGTMLTVEIPCAS
jgi:signal transduction histidine kinase